MKLFIFFQLKYATPLEVILKRERKNGSTVGDCVNFGSCCNPPAVASDEKQGCLPSKSRAIGLAL